MTGDLVASGRNLPLGDFNVITGASLFTTGGRIGPGTQYMSWISLEDAVGAFTLALTREELSGPINTTAPAPVTNQEFTRALGQALKRPTLFPMPAFIARAVFGEMAEALLLSSTRIAPQKLEAAGYPFRHPTVDRALQSLLRAS